VATLPELSKLRIPVQKKEKSWFDTRPKQVAAWVDSLPLGDTEKTTKELFSALSHINRVIIPPAARLKTMHALHDTFVHCIEALKNNFVGQSFPLSARALKYVDRSIAMYAEWAVGYKVAVSDLLERGRFYEKKTTIDAIYHAIDTLDRILLTHYQIYAPEPALIWNEIHTLYHIAEDRGLSKLTINTSRQDSKIKPTVESKYKETMLLSLSNPYHLGKNEIELVYRSLTEWAHSTRLLNPAEVRSGTAHFVTCLNQDKAPVQLSLIKTLENNVCRFIDTTDLIQHLRYLVSQPAAETYLTSSSPSVTNREYQMYKQLLSAWDTREKRSFSRSASHGGIDISIGLNSTHFLIEEASTPLPTPELVEKKPADDGPVVDDTRNPLNVNHTTFSIEPVAGEATGEFYWKQGANPKIQNLTNVGERKENSQLPQPKYNYHKWKTLNVGAGGFCLLWDHDKSSNAQIGEIVGIREMGNGKSNVWRIGVVRWMQYIRQQGLKLGIQILSPDANTISSKLMKGRASMKKEYSCLSLPEMQSMHQPASIITPSLHYKVGDALILNDHGKMMNVQLTRLVENTGNYSRFQYISLNQKENSDFEKEIFDQTNKWYNDP